MSQPKFAETENKHEVSAPHQASQLDQLRRRWWGFNGPGSPLLVPSAQILSDPPNPG